MGVSTTVLVLVVLAGASIALLRSTGLPPLDVVARGTPFSIGWLPPTLVDIGHKLTMSDFGWTSTAGTKGKVHMTEGLVFAAPPPSHQEIILTVTPANEYPAAYWPSFVASSAWRHSLVNGRLVIFPNQVNGGTAIASAKIRGYLVL